MSRSLRLCSTALLMASLVCITGCTRRQLAPGILAGTGAIMTTSGGIYRATMDTDRAFGETPGEIAGSTILIFGGIGLLIAGVVWSITSNHCDDNGDCWSNDVCERRTHTCIDADVVRRLHPNNDSDEEEDDEEADEEEEDDSPRDT